MKIYKFTLIILTAFSFFGCSDSSVTVKDDSRAEEYYSLFNKEAIEKRVQAGMSRQELTDIYGKPSLVYNQGHFDMLVFAVPMDEETVGKLTGFTAVFDDGVLIRTEGYTYRLY